MTDALLVSRLLWNVRASRESGHSCFTPGDFCYRWQTETSEKEPPIIRIWRDDLGKDAGFTWLSGDHLHIITQAETERLRDAMLARGEDQLRSRGNGQVLRIPIDERASGWQTSLTRWGYKPGQPDLVLRSHAMETIAEPSSLPQGYRLTHMQGRAQLDGWAAAYREVFAPEEMTTGVRRAIGRSPLYRPDLDLIACDANDRVAAFALAWFDPMSATGAFEPVGCVPAHQRRGLSRALLFEGLRRLKLLGAQRAFVTTTCRRVAANSLYESVGFQQESICRTWSKPGA